MIKASTECSGSQPVQCLGGWLVCSRAEQYHLRAQTDRRAWKHEQPSRCMFCSASPQWPELQVHEIERRSQAPRTWAQRCNYLLLCQPCHAGQFATMPHAKQLALKFVRDRSHYDLQEWLRIKDPIGRAPDRVTQEEVDRFVAELIPLLEFEKTVSREKIQNNQ
jgi:hypothetical protein